jgi:nitroreductase
METVQSSESGIAATPPEKRADTGASVHELFRNRWSPRSFSPRQISDSELLTVLDAAHWAASSYNEQPWRFIVARKSDSAAFERILELLTPTNRSWAKSASVLIIMAARTTFSNNGTENYYGLHDAGQACAYILLQSTALGFQGHAMAGFDKERAKAELEFPEGYVPGAAIALGYVDSPDKLDMKEKFRISERARRQRKPLSELAFLGAWQQPLEL